MYMCATLSAYFTLYVMYIIHVLQLSIAVFVHVFVYACTVILPYALICFQSLKFQRVAHEVTTYDVQITVDGGVLVFVVGQLKV